MNAEVRKDDKASILPFRLDGFANFFTRFGTAKDRVASSGINLDKQPFRTEPELTAIYRSDGIGRRIVDLPVNDGTRKWIEFPEDTDGKLVKELAKIKTKQAIRNAWRWARLYGGGVIVMGIDDGAGDFAEPLNEDNIRSIAFLRVFDRYRVQFSYTDLETDSSDPNYGNPRQYTIQPINMPQFICHHSRLIRFDGAELPDRERLQNQGWGASEFEAIFESLKSFNISHAGAANIITDFIQTVLSIQNLQAMLAAGQEELVKKRLDIIDRGRSVLNTILLDQNEQYSKQASSVAGLPDLLDRFQFLLCAVTGIPMSILFGRSPSGLNANGDSEKGMWYDLVGSEQQDIALDPIDRIKSLTLKSKESSIKSDTPEEYTTKFCDLNEMTEKERADARYVVAQADHIYMADGAVDPLDIAESRFGGNSYSAETTIDKESMDLMKATRAAVADQTINPPDPAPVVVPVAT